jgi:hypothetical protein
LGFFFGWAQLGVPPDSYGVIRSKTHGIDERLVVPGEFRWVWYKLIPTNTQTLVFRLDTVSRKISVQNMLPSGSTYAALTGVEADDFSWEIHGTFSFSLKSEALIPLVTAQNMGPQELADFQQDIAGQIENFIVRRMNQSEEFAGQIEDMLVNGESPALEKEILEQFPQITRFSLMLQSAKIPNFALYNHAKGLYDEFIAMQKDYLSGDMRERARNRSEFIGRLGELELYGELLTKYPLLLEFMALENSRR